MDGVDPNASNNNNQTPLLWSAQRGSDMVVKLLLTQKDVDPNSKDSDGRTPLLWAAQDRF
ncbi:hypothetical protein V2W45_1344222 [Cenococcum geophilum]